MGEEADRQRDVLRQAIEAKLDAAATKQASASKEAREEITGSFRQLGTGVAETLDRAGARQTERLDSLLPCRRKRDSVRPLRYCCTALRKPQHWFTTGLGIR